MRTSAKGIALIKEFEGCRLEAYPDPGTGGVPWTIGFGHTKNVKKGMTISEDDAEVLLRGDLIEFEKCVTNSVKGQITQEQFDALVCFSFNVGCNNLRTSTLLRKLNDGDEIGASEEFTRWNKAAGKVMAGLTRRRKAEQELFLT